MSSLLKFFSNLYTITIIFFTLLFLELVLLVRSITGNIFLAAGNRPMTTAQYLKLIDKKNPSSPYKNGGLKQEYCSVCLSKFKEGEEIRRVKICKHAFHKKCLDTWLLQDRATCPLCRMLVLPEEIVARYRRQRNGEDSYVGSVHEDMMVMLSALQGDYMRRLPY